jgi:hypothetical protein
VAEINFTRRFWLVALLYFGVLGASPAIRACQFVIGNPVALELSQAAAIALTRVWHTATSRRLRNVAGSRSFAWSATFYSSDHLSEFTECDWRKAPWMTPERIDREGLAIICDAMDRWCLDTAQAMFGGHMELSEITLRQSFLYWRGPASTLVFMILRPKV